MDDVCKPKLAKILSDGDVLVKQLDQPEEAEVTDKMTALKDRTERVDTAVTITRMKYVHAMSIIFEFSGHFPFRHLCNTEIFLIKIPLQYGHPFNTDISLEQMYI